MPNKLINVSYDQVPHIVLNNPDLDCYQKIIMIHLYKLLKDKKSIIYSNKKLSINSGISIKTIEKKIKKLIELKFIETTGCTFNRRILLGQIFNNSLSEGCSEIEQFPPTEGAYPLTGGNLPPTGGYTKNNKLRTTTKGASAPVVVISSLIDSQIQKAYAEGNLLHSHIRSLEDILNYCSWAIETRDKQFTVQQRAMGLISLIKAGTLEIDKKWINKKLSKLNEGMSEYQEYFSITTQDIKKGRLPADTRVLDFESWRANNANRLH